MNPLSKFSTRGKIWRYPGPAGWFFVNIGKQESAQIKWTEEKKKAGWGYVRVNAKVGKTEWDTTLFPTKEGHYLIAIKALVRKKEKLSEGDEILVEFYLL